MSETAALLSYFCNKKLMVVWKCALLLILLASSCDVLYHFPCKKDNLERKTRHYFSINKKLKKK